MEQIGVIWLPSAIFEACTLETLGRGTGEADRTVHGIKKTHGTVPVAAHTINTFLRPDLIECVLLQVLLSFYLSNSSGPMVYNF